MATGTPKVPIVQQNGTPMMNLPTAPQLRPQFRRQGSSFGGTGYVSSMAVMPVPTKVDYSVTKGGLRLWAVLFVFIFLCSSLYALFSTKELAELTAIDIEDELNADIGQEMDEDVDDVGTQNRKVERDTTESKDNILTSKVLSDAKKEINEEENAPEDDEDNAEEEDLPEEEEMFAKLKAKAEERRKKQKHDKREHHHTVVDEMETKQPEDDEETAKEVKRRVKHKKKSVVEADDDEEVSLDAGKHYEELHGVIEEKLVKDESDKELQEANAEETDEGEEEEKKKPEGQQVSTKGEKIRLKKLQRFGSGSGTPRTIQECKRKNCPMVDEGKPRKELLKQKSRKSALRLYRSRPVELEDEEDEEEEDTTQDEVEVEDEENAVEDELDEISASDENQDLSVAKYERLYRKAYKRHAITNREDDRFRTLLDKADNLVEKVRRKKRKSKWY